MGIPLPQGGSGEQRLLRLLLDPEDDELGRVYRRRGDDADQPAVPQVVLGHRGAVAGDGERLVGGGTGERPAAPDRAQEVAHGLADQRPQGLAVRLEHRPLGALVDGLLQVEEQAAYVDVSPLRVGREGTGTPDPGAQIGEGAQRVDPARVQYALLALVDVLGDAAGGQDAADGHVGRGLVHAAIRVDPRVDAGQVTGRRYLGA